MYSTPPPSVCVCGPLGLHEERQPTAVQGCFLEKSLVLKTCLPSLKSAPMKVMETVPTEVTLSLCRLPKRSLGVSNRSLETPAVAFCRPAPLSEDFLASVLPGRMSTCG